MQHMDKALQILAEELAEVTPAMIDAGQRALAALTIRTDSRGRRHFVANVTAADELVAIWRAMLRAKLTDVG